MPTNKSKGKIRRLERDRGREGGGEGTVGGERERKRRRKGGGGRERESTREHPVRASCKMSVECLFYDGPEVSI